MNMNLPMHREAIVEIAASPDAVFAVLDDHRRLAAHMARPSAMLAGGSMRLDFGPGDGRAVGTEIRMRGRLLGVDLRLDEAVVERVAPLRKVWQTMGEPRLLVIGRYRMGFALEPLAAGTRLTVWIDYALPSARGQRWLGRLLGGAYARWCVARMARDAARALR